MESRIVEVTRYYAFDGAEFSDSDVCLAHERNIKKRIRE